MHHLCITVNIFELKPLVTNLKDKTLVAILNNQWKYLKARAPLGITLTRSLLFALLVVQLPSHVQFFVTLWTVAHQASLSLTISQSLPTFMSIESVMPSNHLILCHALFLLPYILFALIPSLIPSQRASKKPKFNVYAPTQ